MLLGFPAFVSKMERMHLLTDELRRARVHKEVEQVNAIKNVWSSPDGERPARRSADKPTVGKNGAC